MERTELDEAKLRDNAPDIIDAHEQLRNEAVKRCETCTALERKRR